MLTIYPYKHTSNEIPHHTRQVCLLCPSFVRASCRSRVPSTRSKRASTRLDSTRSIDTDAKPRSRRHRVHSSGFSDGPPIKNKRHESPAVKRFAFYPPRTRVSPTDPRTVRETRRATRSGRSRGGGSRLRHHRRRRRHRHRRYPKKNEV
jgi:hypothetical protein